FHDVLQQTGRKVRLKADTTYDFFTGPLGLPASAIAGLKPCTTSAAPVNTSEFRPWRSVFSFFRYAPRTARPSCGQCDRSLKTMASIDRTRTQILLVAAIGVLVAGAPAARQTQKPPATYQTLPSETPKKFEPATDTFEYVKRDVMIPMRD